MASQFEVLASAIKRDHDQLAYELGSDFRDDGNAAVLISILRVLHDAAKNATSRQTDDILGRIVALVGDAFACVSFDDVPHTPVEPDEAVRQIRALAGGTPPLINDEDEEMSHGNPTD